MAPPSVVSNWLNSAYPSLNVKLAWLSACCDYIEANSPGLSGTALVRKVNSQLQLADLSEVCLSGTLPSKDLSNTQSTRIATQRGGILVQIEGIFEIGHSTLAISEAHKQRKEDAKMGLNRARVIGNIEDDSEDSKGPAKFPRAMLMFQLGDGFRSVKAIEYKRIPELSLDDSQLGCKLLLKNVRAARGVLLLEPSCVSVKGGSIKELDDQKANSIDAEISHRLGLPEPEPELVQVNEPRQAAPPHQQGPVQIETIAPIPAPAQAPASPANQVVGYARPILPDEDDFDYNMLPDGWDDAELAGITDEENADVTAALEGNENHTDDFEFSQEISAEVLAAVEEAEQASSLKQASSAKQMPSSMPPVATSTQPEQKSRVIDLSSSDEEKPIAKKKKRAKKQKTEIIMLSSGN